MKCLALVATISTMSLSDRRLPTEIPPPWDSDLAASEKSMTLLAWKDRITSEGVGEKAKEEERTTKVEPIACKAVLGIFRDNFAVGTLVKWQHDNDFRLFFSRVGCTDDIQGVRPSLYGIHGGGRSIHSEFD